MYMHDLLELFRELTKEGWIVAHGGLYIVMFIIFAETGLFVGFFLPGDSLLFVSGMLIAKSHTPFANPYLDLIYWVILLAFAAIAGNLLGFWFGRKSGHLWFEKRDTWIFKKRHLVQAHEFYEKRGVMAIILGRFLPIVRTFAPLVAGIVDMDRKKFISYSILGALAWVTSMTLAGFLLGKNEWVEKNIDIIVVLIIVITTGPVLFKMIFGRKKTNS